MKLSIRNFAKIRQADIQADGITVIAGENNTGKSTVGKALFALFNASNNIEDKIYQQRNSAIHNACMLNIHEYLVHHRTGERYWGIPTRFLEGICTEMADLMKQGKSGEEEVSAVVHHHLSEFRLKIGEEESEDWIEMETKMMQSIIKILSLPEYDISLEVLTRYFSGVFHQQMNSLYRNQTGANLRLEIKNRTVDITFSENRCSEFSSDIALLHKAVYIDNPFVLDGLDTIDEMSKMEEYLKDLLNHREEDIMDGIIDSVLAKEKMAEIFELLGHVVNGRVLEQNEREYYLETPDLGEPIAISNLSAGMKSFVILKMLLENGILKDKDVLILDEPEIHLHPQWQIVYAQLIVLLQKKFDLSIIVTTHSPYFMDAIDLYSRKHDMDEKVNFYLSKVEDGEVIMEAVTDDVERIYQKMVTPIEALDTLRHELENR